MGDIKTEYSTYFLIVLLIALLSAIGLMVVWVILDKKGYLIRKKKLFDSIRSASEGTIQNSIFTPLHKFKDCTGFSSKRGRRIWKEAVQLANDKMDRIYIPKIESFKHVKELLHFIENVYDINEVYLNNIYRIEKGKVETIEVFPHWMEYVREKFEELVFNCRSPRELSEGLHIFPKKDERYKNLCVACDTMISIQVNKLLSEKNLNIKSFSEIAAYAKAANFIHSLNEDFVKAMQRETDLLKIKEIPSFLETVIKELVLSPTLQPALKEVCAIREEAIVDLYEPTAGAKLEEIAPCLKGFTSAKAIFAFFDKVEAVIPGMKHQLFSKVYLKQ